MKKYLADMLTLSRLVIALYLLILVFVNAAPETALWLFVAGQITDAFDGICARKFPFKEGEEPWYRRDQRAEVYEEAIDMFLGIIFLVFLALRVDPMIGGSLLAFSVVGGLVTEIVAWGRPLGSDKPGRHSARCLYVKNSLGCCKLVLIRRGVYLAIIVYAALHMLFACAYPTAVKLTIIGVAIIGGSILLICKRDRLTQIKTR